MHTFYLYHPPSCKWFDLWDVKQLLSFLGSWVLTSSLTNFKLAWKAGTIWALVTAKHCYELTLLHFDNQHLLLQHYAAIFVPASGGKMDQSGYLPLEICVESHSSVNLCPMFYLKPFYTVQSLLGGQMDLWCLLSFWVTIDSTCWYVTKQFLQGKGKVLSIAKSHMSLGTVWGGAALVAGISLASILQVGDWARVSIPAKNQFFHGYHNYRSAPGFHAACCSGP